MLPANWTGFTIHRTLETLYDASDRKIRDTLREGAAGAIRGVTQYSYACDVEDQVVASSAGGAAESGKPAIFGCSDRLVIL